MQKVLVVDDEAEIVGLMSVVLGNGDLSLFAAYDGREALDLVRKHQPRIVLTDVLMPRLDGRELCRLIRSDPSTSDTIVILMSALDPRDLAGCDADEVIRKPFDITFVRETINRFLTLPTSGRSRIAYPKG